MKNGQGLGNWVQPKKPTHAQKPTGFKPTGFFGLCVFKL